MRTSGLFVEGCFHRFGAQFGAQFGARDTAQVVLEPSDNAGAGVCLRREGLVKCVVSLVP